MHSASLQNSLPSDPEIEPFAENDISPVPETTLVDDANYSVIENKQMDYTAISISAAYEAPDIFRHHDIYSRNILEFLSAQDLCHLSQCSKFCHLATLQGHLWNQLTAVDFSANAENLLHNDHAYAHEEVYGGYIPIERNKYKAIYTVVCNRIRRAQDTRQQVLDEEALERKMEVVERCIDFSQFRFFIVLPGLVALATLILFGLKYDGASFSVWYCLAPLFFFLLYILVGVIISWLFFRARQNLNSSLRNFWMNMRSPVNTLYENILEGNLGGKIFVCIAYFLFACQLIFLGIKLSGDVRAMDNTKFDWGIVFLPLWLLFAMYLCVPIIWRNVNGAYPVVLVLLWLPFLIFFICIAIKLNRNENDARTLSMDLILIPFWIIEGVFLLVGVVNLLVQYRRCVYPCSMR